MNMVARDDRFARATCMHGYVGWTLPWPYRNMHGCLPMMALRRSCMSLRPGVQRHSSVLPGRIWQHSIHSSVHAATRQATSRSIRYWAAGLAGGIGLMTYTLLRSSASRTNAVQDLSESTDTASPTSSSSTPKDEPPPASFAQSMWGWTVRYLIDPFFVLKRFIYLSILFLPVLLTVPLLFCGASSTVTDDQGHTEERPGWGARFWFAFLVKQMELAGPTFVKLGQWAGSRRDLFPEALCNQLAKLHSSNHPHSMKHTRKVLESVFGLPFDEIFTSFDTEPVGVGAVGQVYKAVLRSDLLPRDYLVEKIQVDKLHQTAEQIGRELALTYDHDESLRHVPGAAVAIKVLHPNVRSTIDYDIQIMSFFAGLINMFPGMKWVSFPEEVERFSALMFSQLDLRTEASNLTRFEKNFVRRGGTVTFPRPLQVFCTREVLVEELIDAVPLKHFMKMGGLDYDMAIAEMGLDAFLQMLLIDNFTHADLHPGNIMVKFYRPTTRSMLQNAFSRILSRFDPSYLLGHPSRTGILSDEVVVEELLSRTNDKRAWLSGLRALEDEGYLPELVILDAGLVSELSPKNLRNFLDLFAAIVTFDGRRAGELMVERCRTPELVTDKKSFVNVIGSIMDSVHSDSFSLASLNIGDVLSQVLSSVRQYHVKMESDFMDTILSILILEGIGRRLYPDLDLFTRAVPILRSLGQKMTTDETQLASFRENMSVANIWPMFKLWVYLEARSLFANTQHLAHVVDAFVRYGWFSD